MEDVQNRMKDRAAAVNEEVLEHLPAVWLKQKIRTKTTTLSQRIPFSEGGAEKERGKEAWSTGHRQEFIKQWIKVLDPTEPSSKTTTLKHFLHF